MLNCLFPDSLQAQIVMKGQEYLFKTDILNTLRMAGYPKESSGVSRIP